MKVSSILVIGALAALVSGESQARDPYMPRTMVSGRVLGSYVRAAPGVFIEAGIAPRSMQGEKWVDVDPRDGGAGVMARVPVEMNAEPGAEVEIRVAGLRRYDVAPVGERTQVVNVTVPAGDGVARRLAQSRNTGGQ